MKQIAYHHLLQKSDGYQNIVKSLAEEKSPIEIYGLAPQGIGFIGGNLYSDCERPILILTYEEKRARKIQEDLQYFLGEGVYFLPEKDLFFFEQDAGGREVFLSRLEVFLALTQGEVKVVVSTFEGVKGLLPSGAHLDRDELTARVGEILPRERLLAYFDKSCYERVDVVEGVGQFSLRGGILDVYGPTDLPIRLEFFDDEVDSIRYFDEKNQRSIENLKEITFTPMTNVFLSEEIYLSIADDMEADLHTLMNQKEVAGHRAEEKFAPLIEKLRTEQDINNMDLILPYVPQERLGNIFSYFRMSPLLIIDEPNRIKEKREEKGQTQREELFQLYEAGEILPAHLHFYSESPSLPEFIEGRAVLLLNAILRRTEGFMPKEILSLPMKTIDSFHGRLTYFQEEIASFLKMGRNVVILSGEEEKTERIIDSLKELDLPARPLTEVMEENIVYVDGGSTHGGFEFPEANLVLLNAREIYGRKKSLSPKKKKGKHLIDLDHLKAGDYVVHESHGIGRFLGSSTLQVQGTTRDYITIEYKGGDKLFLPMEQLALIHRYSSSEDGAPKLNSLSSSNWKKTKSRAKRAVEEMAEDLVALYATRKENSGHAFAPDTPWQKEFEDSFLYEETPGQLEATQEIKADMESRDPMDRLLCADVGYGKTEVALRAAFKAVMDGKQVAFLVPTTVLAQQHYKTMKERFSDFPLEIGILSRFQSKREISKTLEKAKNGSIDILLGTHRLLSEDVKFKDLGLLIIDEEQRFGVRHKEQLRLMKNNVDTLTLTATPIPRTLQMSMGGIRDMSVISDPPEERYPVQTYVIEYSDILAREAIRKELNRGGQIYFVYNQVASMDHMLAELKKLVPEAKISMAHGQMRERELESTMIAFIDGEIDVLLCSTIIETGMDVANANTMIVWEANHFGLSQLYQLRGRIGRSNRVAYCYLTYRKNAPISEVAEKRLRTIREFTEFGSGFKIAQRDLEIRGSGNILGESQSGHMMAIGYDLYLKYLNEAVGRLKGEDHSQAPTTLDIHIDAFIPETYIEDEFQRMEIYRKVASIENDGDKEDLIDELLDRFGDIPAPIYNIMEISHLRYRASRKKIESITQRRDQLMFQMEEGVEFSLALINSLTWEFKKDVVFSPGEVSSFTIKNVIDPIPILQRIMELLERDQSVKKL